MRHLTFLLAPLLLTTHLTHASQSLDGIAAVVNDNIVTQSELKQQVKLFEKQMGQNGAAKVDKAVLEKQILEQLIAQEIQYQVAKRTGIHVEEYTLDNALEKIAKDNQMTIKDLRQALAKEGMDFTQYREGVRKQMTLSQLHQRDIIHQISVNEQEINHFLQTAKSGINEMAYEYHLGHILISLPETPTPDQLEAGNKKAEEVIKALAKGQDFSQVALTYSTGELALKGGDLGWRKLPELPTLFVKVAQTLKINEVPKPIRSASGLHIVKLIDKRALKQAVSQVEKTAVRHILIKTNAMTSDKDANLKLTEIRKKILNGEDFSQFAKTYSADLGSASNGGNLGFVTKEVLVPEFSKVMVSLKINEVSEPFQTPFGWHIMQVLARKTEADDQAMLRHKAGEMIKQRKFEEKLQSWTRQLRDEAFVKTYLDSETESVKIPRLILTLGEPAGIGPDITVLIAQHAFPAEIVVVGSPQLLEERAKLLGHPLTLTEFDPTKPSLPNGNGKLSICPVDLNAPCTPGQLNPENSPYVITTLTRAYELCAKGQGDALITCPVHKAIIQQSGTRFLGHTEFFAHLANVHDVLMTFYSPHLIVALVTTHCPLQEVSKKLTKERLTSAINLLHQGLIQLFQKPHPLIGVCGLNPHAGESGLLGYEEQEIIIPVLEQLKTEGYDLLGPLPGDTAFIESSRNQVDAFLSMYHDQGLAPIKALYFGETVNMTLGLPFLRTSVSHGTALSLAGKGQASPDSLIKTIALTAQLCISQFVSQKT